MKYILITTFTFLFSLSTHASLAAQSGAFSEVNFSEKEAGALVSATTLDQLSQTLKDELIGQWETDAGFESGSSSLRIELLFTETDIQVQTLCEFFPRDSAPVELVATATAPIRYRRDGVQITRSAKSRVDQGRFFCEAVAGISFHRVRIIDENTVVLINIDNNKRIRLFRK